jgi:peptide-methionine (S)-S-oxide reductase
MQRTSSRAVLTLVVISAVLSAFAPRLRASGDALTVPAHALDGAARARPDTAVFAGGCFWGIEAVFDHVKGVQSAESGYAGGVVPSPSYDRVSTGTTGHAESVRVIFDPAQVTYGQLLQIFFSVAHDPTELNRQGPDVGSQYRSAIFYRTMEQKHVADAYVAQLAAARTYSRPIVTQITRLNDFYPAEPYHQHYLEHHLTQPYIVINDLPKVDALKRQFPALYKG